MTALATVRPFRAAPHHGGGVLTLVPPLDISSLDVTLDRPIPQSPDAERAVLGSVLINNNVWFRIPNLTTDSFFKDAHRTIFGVMALMVEERLDIEPLTLKEELAKHGKLDAVGGVAYISSLLDMVPDVANIERYAAIVERMAKKRANLITGNKLMRASLDLDPEPEEDAAAAMALLSPVATREDQQARPLVQVLSDAFTRMQALAAADKSVALDCGWPTLLDHKVFFPTFVVCSADRGLGKSSLMIEWSRGFARNGHPTVMFSLESAPHDISLRYASMVTGIPHRFMRDWRTFSDANRQKVAECLRDAASLGIHIAKGPRTLEGIILEIRRLKVMHGIQAAFVDYLQLLSTSRRFERSELGFNHIAQEFLATAVEHDVVICGLSQVNKEGGVAYADSIEKSARVRLHFDRPHPQGHLKCDYDNHTCLCDGSGHTLFRILKNNEERTGGFDAYFNEVTQQWNEGTCRTLRNAPVERKLFT